MMVDRLNELLAGDPLQKKRPKDIVLQTARDPMRANVFNYASMAHNNHFFFNGLSVSPDALGKHPSLETSLSNTFGSMETLQTTFIDTAAAMFGPGFVWLVYMQSSDSTRSHNRKTPRQSGGWRILTTYNAGTPYPEAGYRRQGLDMSTNGINEFVAYQQNANPIPVNDVGSFGNHSLLGKQQTRPEIPPGGTTLVPVLCVNTWEHVYMPEFGVAGKRNYLKKWWDCIDWGQVDHNTPDDVKYTSAPGGYSWR